jgi:carbon-monoxide dehydrogenase medium subunit
MVTYSRARSIAEAVAALSARPDTTRLLGGGTDVLVALAPDRDLDLIDIKHIADLPAGLTVDSDGGVAIGPTLTMSELIARPDIAPYGALADAAAQVGSVLVRNRATLIGNVCNASPAGDTLCPLLVHDAVVELTGADGVERVPLAEFFTGVKQTVCGPRFVTRLVLPAPRAASAYLRLTRRKALDLATVGVAAAVDADSRVRLAFAAVGPTPVLAPWSEPIDVADDAALSQVVEAAAALARPISDIRGGAAYRAAMIRVLGTRAARQAAARRK